MRRHCIGAVHHYELLGALHNLRKKSCKFGLTVSPIVRLIVCFKRNNLLLTIFSIFSTDVLKEKLSYNGLRPSARWVVKLKSFCVSNVNSISPSKNS